MPVLDDTLRLLKRIQYLCKILFLNYLTQQMKEVKMVSETSFSPLPFVSRHRAGAIFLYSLC